MGCIWRLHSVLEYLYLCLGTRLQKEGHDLGDSYCQNCLQCLGEIVFAAEKMFFL